MRASVGDLARFRSWTWLLLWGLRGLRLGAPGEVRGGALWFFRGDLLLGPEARQ
jgi:hypothetical protein